MDRQVPHGGGKGEKKKGNMEAEYRPFFLLFMRATRGVGGSLNRIFILLSCTDYTKEKQLREIKSKVE